MVGVKGFTIVLRAVRVPKEAHVAYVLHLEFAAHVDSQESRPYFDVVDWPLVTAVEVRDEWLREVIDVLHS